MLLISKKQKSFLEPNHKHSLCNLRKIETPNVKTAQELADFLGRPVDEIVKTMIFKVDGEYMVLVRGHHEINDIKLKSYFGTDNIELDAERNC